MKNRIVNTYNKLSRSSVRGVLMALLKITISQLQRINHFLARKDIVPNPLSFDDLTPVEDADKSKPYLDSLYWALTNKKIKNIAITGPYGSGKSSIIKTFEAHYPGFRYLNISLASFSETKIDKGVDGQPKGDKNQGGDLQKAEKHRLIELSILQQMFYKVSGSDIPDSRFKRINHLHWWKMFGLTTLVLSTALGFGLIFRQDFFQRLCLWGNYNNDIAQNGVNIGFGLVILSFSFLLTFFFRYFNHSKLNKLNLSSGQIEVDSKSDTSILNKHFDEILYFFEATKFNIVVIEDLDRFDDPEIFTKLREINILLNNAAQIKRRIVFIYAIKDDIFQDKRRAKFFDFIIPVIPVINWSNSLDKMLPKVKDLGISTSFLADITLYIDDMRVLKNILNEFMLYRENLKVIPVKQEQLLAMMIYKNIYPKDFAELHENKGILYNVFLKKPDLIKETIQIKTDRIIELEKDIENLNELYHSNVKELRSAYVVQLLSEYPGMTGLRVNNRKVQISKLIEDQYFHSITSANYLEYYHLAGNSSYEQSMTNHDYSFGVVETKVNSHFTYMQREKLLQQKLEGKLNECRLELERLNSEVSEIKDSVIKDILTSHPNSLTLLSDDFQDKKLLIYLVREGFIDEMYPSLITYFYEESLTANDMAFLMSVKNREPLNFNYSLNKITGLVRRLSPHEYQREAILNYDLINFLLDNTHSHSAEFETISKQLSNGQKTSIDFIDGFISYGQERSIPSFVNAICKSWAGFWRFVEMQSEYSKEKKDKYLSFIIKYVELDNLSNVNQDNNLSRYISLQPDFLTLFSDELNEKLKQVIERLKVRFHSLALKISSKELIDFIYNGQYYQINPYMLYDLLDYYAQDKEAISQHFETANLTTILSSGCTKLIDDIKANLDTYVEDVYLELSSNTKESEGTIKELLNSKEVHLLNKSRIIITQETLIGKITDIDNELWSELLEHGKILPVWENVAAYYIHSENVLDEVMLSYLNRIEVYSRLSEIKLSSQLDIEEATIKSLSKDLILNIELSESSYGSLLKSINYIYKNLPFDLLPSNKVDLLIENNRLSLSADNFSTLKTKFTPKHLNLIEKRFAEYLALQEELLLVTSEIVFLLKSNKITLDNKVSIIPQITDDMINPELAGLIVKLHSEKPSFILEYTVLKKIIEKLPEQEKKLLIFNSFIEKLDGTQVKELLELIGGKYAEIADENKRPLIPDILHNQNMLFRLKFYRFISDYKKEKDGFRVSHKNKKK